MGTQNFHPKNVILLDGYWLVKKVFPDANLHDYDECQEFLNIILKEVVFDPWAYVNRANNTNSSGYWLILGRKHREESEVFNILKKDGEEFAFNALLPNGQLLEIFRKIGLKSTFTQKGIQYAEFDDGTFIQITPSLDERFLELYKDEVISFSYSVEEENYNKTTHLKYISEDGIWVDENGDKIVLSTKKPDKTYKK